MCGFFLTLLLLCGWAGLPTLNKVQYRFGREHTDPTVLGAVRLLTNHFHVMRLLGNAMRATWRRRLRNL